MKINTIILLILVFTFPSCKDKKVIAPPPPDIKVVKVLQKDTPVYREFVGQMYGLKDIPIQARVEGFLEKILFEEGARVKKGQLLYTMDSKPFEEQVATQQSMVAEARTILVQSENDLKRVIPLAEMDAVSQRELDMAQAKRDASISSVEAAEANLNLAKINLSYTRIRSPIKGVIGKTEAREGEFVGKSQSTVILNTVSRIDTMRVQFFLTESLYLTLAKKVIGRKFKDKKERKEFDDKDEIKGNYNLELILSDGETYNYKGTVDFINRNVDPKTGSLLVQAHFPNPDRILRPGLFAKIRVEMDVVKDALLIPQRSINELQGKYSVFVIKEDNTVESRQVSIGEKIGDLQIITEGLKVGESVVLEGLQKVGSGLVVNPTTVVFKSQKKINN
ncbi:MAG: efflux RND transporter periplasmic adaptor subunit [Flavobacteriaceae bacterium]|nr:efflux RND transporter periplasmic adaptor subunit [Flavobacteriaceae bacterium]